MEASRLASVLEQGQEAGRAWHFLVSGLDGDEPVTEWLAASFAPVFERLGSWERVLRPESRLVYLAAQAASTGHRPIHINLGLARQAYLTPALPTVLVCPWDYPDVPARNLGGNPKLNLARIARRANLVLTTSERSAAAFRASDVPVPARALPVPAHSAAFDLAGWSSENVWRGRCRHEVLGEPTAEPEPAAVIVPVPEARPAGRLARLRRELKSHYKRHVRPRLSPRLQDWVSHAKLAAWRAVHFRPRRRPVPASAPAPSRLRPTRLRLSGTVYLSVVDVHDPAENLFDLLSAFAREFAERPDVALVLRLAGGADNEAEGLARLRAIHASLGMDHRCRMIVITDDLSDESMLESLSGAAYYVTARRSEGTGRWARLALAAGRPLIAPSHTALEPILDDRVGFVVASHPEPTHWPDDPERRLETSWHRLVWTSLRDALARSAEAVEDGSGLYDALSSAARERMMERGSIEHAAHVLRDALAPLEATTASGWDWAA